MAKPNQTMSALYPFNWRYNSHDNKWYASKNHHALWNNLSSNEVIGSSKVEILVGLIRQYGGDTKAIHEAIK